MTAQRSFVRVLEAMGPAHRPHDVFRAFVRLSACALAVGTREREYLEEAKRWKREELDRFAEAFAALVQDMEAEPFSDLLGVVHMDTLGESGQKHGGEFHTPQPVAELMGLMTALTSGHIDPESSEPITLCEPACGSGAMILAYAKALPGRNIRRLRVTAVDINATACDMCFINTSLWGIPTTIVHGNTLSGETWAQWRNVHMALPWFWRFIPAQDEALAATAAAPEPEHTPTPSQAAALAALAPHQGQPPTPTEAAALREQFGQLDLFPPAA